MRKKVILSLVCAAGIIASSLTLNLSAASYSGSGTMQDPYLVSNAEQLQAMRDNLSAHYKLSNTVDLSGVDFKPIGRLDAPFTGSFVCERNADGSPKYVIKNLKITVAETPYSAENKNKWEAALFGAAKNAIFSGISVLDVSVSNNVIGDNQGNVVYGDYKPGMDEMNSAALIGKADGCTVTYCTSSGSIKTKSNHCGGLIGYAVDTTVEGCYSTAEVSSSGKWCIGGLIGSAENCTVSQSYAVGNVSGSQSNISSFAGSISGGSYTDCYATGNAAGGKERKNNFGTWNKSTNGATFKNCYASGSVDATVPNSENDGSVSNCWTLSGAQGGMEGFTAGSMADIKAAFSGLSNWKTDGDKPELVNVPPILDAAAYTPGAVQAVESQGQTGGDTASGSSDSAATESTAEVNLDELYKLIEELPDPEKDGAVTLDCKENAMKAWDMYNALTASQQDDFDANAATKLNKVRYQLSLLMASDVVDRINALPEKDKLTSKNVKEILSLWKDYEFLDDKVKAEIDSDLVKKLEDAYDYAKEHENDADSTAAVSNDLNTFEWVIVIASGVILVLCITFDVFAGVWFLKKKKALQADTVMIDESEDDIG